MSRVAEPSAGQGKRARGPGERERVTVRRALIAGAVAWALLGVPLSVGMAPSQGPASPAGALLGLVFGGVVASAWLLTALTIDLWTRQPLGRRRLVWTAAVTLATMLSPVLPVAALRAGG
ncbi:MAG: hypothetical protein BRC31_04835 [Actinobacteria bacterium QS_5_72_10]|nr:MAG: hypothetical protein BRC31_04835 [Actinobacteria bacterium QS_5_72_10]